MALGDSVAAPPDSYVHVLFGALRAPEGGGLDGTITTVAGNGELGLSGDGGPATAARMSVFKVAVGPHGGFVVAGRSIRRVTRRGIIRSVAGDLGPESLGMPDRTTDRLLGNGGSAHKAYLDTSDVAISPDDDYLIAGYRLRLLAAPGTRRLGLAIRATAGSRHRISYSLSKPAELRLELRLGARRWVWRRYGETRLGHFRLPRDLADGPYQFLITARAEDGQRAAREDALITGRKLQRDLAVAAVRYAYGFAPIFTRRGLNRGETLFESALVQEGDLRARCHRFGRLRVDCRLGAWPRWGGGCRVNVAVRLDPGQGQLFTTIYACGSFKQTAVPIAYADRWNEVSLLTGGPWLMARAGQRNALAAKIISEP